MNKTRLLTIILAAATASMPIFAAAIEVADTATFLARSSDPACGSYGNVIYLADFSQSMIRNHLENVNFYFNTKWKQAVFQLMGDQPGSAGSTTQVRMRVLADSIDTCDSCPAAAIAAIKAAGSNASAQFYDPAGPNNKIFTGAWADTICSKPYATDSGRTVCGNYLSNSNNVEGSNTKVIMPAPSNLYAMKWTIEKYMTGYSDVRQSLVAFPDISGTKDVGAPAFSYNTAWDTQLSLLRNAWSHVNTPGANATTEMRRWLAGTDSFNFPGHTYDGSDYIKTPLSPGVTDANQDFTIIILSDGKLVKDCNTDLPLDKDNDCKDASHCDPKFPDKTSGASGFTCYEGGGIKNYLLDDQLYTLRQQYPNSKVEVFGFQSSGNGKDYLDHIATVMKGSTGTMAHFTNMQTWDDIDQALTSILTKIKSAVYAPALSGGTNSFAKTGSQLIVPELEMDRFLGNITICPESDSPGFPCSANGAGVSPISVGKVYEDPTIPVGSRKILINLPGIGVKNFVSSDSTVKNTLKSRWNGVWSTDTEVADAIDWIRGDHSKETPLGTLRGRKYKNWNVTNQEVWSLGEVYTAPIVVGPPKGGYGEYAYNTSFAVPNKARTPMLYFASGDGMIHAANYTTGVVNWSFIPAAMIERIATLPKQTYLRRGFIDGKLQAFDLCDFETPGTDPSGKAVPCTWKTVLTATMANGGKSIVLGDISDPASFNLIAEITSPNLGLTFSPVLLGRFKDTDYGEKFWFVTGNGFNGADGKAHVVVFDSSGGVHELPALDEETDNGCSSIAVLDRDGNSTVDEIYAGTYNGKVYRITTPDSDFNSWGAPELVADFSSAGLHITAAPLVARRNGKTILTIGTGKLLSESDVFLANHVTNYLMSFEVQNTAVTLDNLRKFDSSLVNSSNQVLAPSNKNGQFYAVLSEEENNPDVAYGYAVRLPQDQVITQTPTVLADGILTASLRPGEGLDACYRTGRSIVWYLSLGGSNPELSGTSNFDRNDSGTLNADDQIGGKQVVGVQMESGTTAAFPKVDFEKNVLTISVVEFSGDITGGVQTGEVTNLKIKNRFRGTPGFWKEK